MACNKQKINKHDKFSTLKLFGDGDGGILKADNYLYYKYGFLWEWRIKA